MSRKNKKIGGVVIIILILFCWQTWASVSLNDLLAKPLIVKQTLAEAQVLIVHGCGLYTDGRLTECAQERVDWARKLLTEGLAQQIILSGGYTNGGLTEAQAMADYLKKQGVSSSQLFLESKSQSTWQNVLNSLEILKQHNWSRILVVTSPFHTARTFLVWQKVCPGCELEISSPRTSWLLTPGLSSRWSGLKMLVREYLALGYYKLSGRL
ncbi:MAG: YdcF family protein [Candidatus Komeilibacteria bacterium]|nr:YdcF family protein [Candidatus Komeilibacteria bacterium]